MVKKLTIGDLREMKSSGRPISASSAYDYATIQLMNGAEIDVVMPDDWGLATTLLGYPSALQLGMDEVLLYLGGLTRLVERGVIVAPMPFGTYQVSNEDAVSNASRLMKAGADSVKLDGGGQTVERIHALAEVGIPCLGRLGYVPQETHRLGGERVVGNTAEEAAEIYYDVMALQEAGAWGVILHNVPRRVAQVITDRSALVTIGAGGTRDCDGCLILLHDLVGWPQAIQPLFSIRYGDFTERAVQAVNRHVAEVRALEFPTREHTFSIPEGGFQAFMKQIVEE